jgi:GSH-dependent disulfide-bond oxidoreductase
VSTIDLYTWATPNGRKVSILLEELALPYEVHPIELPKGEQHDPAFLRISPNNRIPAIVDPEGPEGEPMSLFESGAILVYLAEKTASPLLPAQGVARARTFEWLMWQMGGVGPMFGQAHHFLFNPKEVVPYGQRRYLEETRRLYRVMNRRLAEVPHLAGEHYTIADIATYPWVARHPRHQVELAEYPAVQAWYERLSEREAITRGMAVPFLN